MYMSLIYTGQKNLRPTCIFPIGLLQKQSSLFYPNLLLDSNCHAKVTVKKQRYLYSAYARFQINWLINSLLRFNHLSEGPASLPISSIVHLALKKGAPGNSNIC